MGAWWSHWSGCTTPSEAYYADLQNAQARYLTPRTVREVPNDKSRFALLTLVPDAQEPGVGPAAATFRPLFGLRNCFCFRKTLDLCGTSTKFLT